MKKKILILFLFLIGNFCYSSQFQKFSNQAQIDSKKQTKELNLKQHMNKKDIKFFEQNDFNLQMQTYKNALIEIDTLINKTKELNLKQQLLFARKENNEQRQKYLDQVLHEKVLKSEKLRLKNKKTIFQLQKTMPKSDTCVLI